MLRVAAGANIAMVANKHALRNRPLERLKGDAMGAKKQCDGLFSDAELSVPHPVKRSFP